MQDVQVGEAEEKEVKVANIDHPIIQLEAQTACSEVLVTGKEL